MQLQGVEKFGCGRESASAPMLPRPRSDGVGAQWTAACVPDTEVNAAMQLQEDFTPDATTGSAVVA